ncbi:MAG: hypothetical protein KTU85_06860 [Acidimicrobiia bacterium]|nr:hypothetical protein [Acidimicrobiia bacterium]MCY4457853.1 hypothetical protein [Acidimicrobiaceae bacterium]
MTNELPFLPKERSNDRALHERVARARQLRENAAARVEERYANYKPQESKLQFGDSQLLEMERLRVL